jgi:predicted nucleic acid-binding protein
VKPVFVDTSGFIALENAKDQHHAEALAFQRRVAEQHLPLLTSNFVLDEAYTWLRLGLGHELALRFGEAIQHSAIVDIAEITPDIEHAAWEIFRRYADKDFSYTDCTSFALMQYLDLPTAFAFDRHFQQFGVEVIHE